MDGLRAHDVNTAERKTDIVVVVVLLPFWFYLPGLAAAAAHIG